jgi:hypothetical protein
VGSLDLPSEPEEPGRPECAGDGGAGRPKPASREAPDPDERGRVYEAMRACAEADRADRHEQVPGPDQRPDETGPRGYWSEVPRFLRMRADHEERWPADRQSTAAADRSADPPGSYRSDGNLYLNPERHAETVSAIGRVRETEPAISADAQTIAKENTCGGWLAGFKFRLKGDDRLKEKVAEGLATSSPDATSEQVLRLIPDAIRYTFCLRPESYARGFYDIKVRLESFGYEMYYSRNSWAKPEYKGINTRWTTQEGQRFEVQFHTPESFHAKQEATHRCYERIRNPLTSKRELRELHSFQREVSATIQVPDGATDIPDYTKEGL